MKGKEQTTSGNDDRGLVGGGEQRERKRWRQRKCASDADAGEDDVSNNPKKEEEVWDVLWALVGRAHPPVVVLSDFVAISVGTCIKDISASVSVAEGEGKWESGRRKGLGGGEGARERAGALEALSGAIGQ